MSIRLLMLLVVIGIIWGGCSMGGGKAKEVQEGMQKYLQATYGMEFVVGKPYMYGNEGTGYIYQAKAYPKGKPEWEFFVEGDKFNTGVYIDGYLQVKWTYQGRQQLEKALKEVYEDDYYLDHYDFRYNNKEFKDLDYDEVIKRCEGDATVTISYDVYLNQPPDKAEQAEKAYKIMKPFLLDYSINKYNCTLVYFAKSFKAEFEKNGNSYGTDPDGRAKSFDTLRAEKKLYNALMPFHIKGLDPISISTSSDLIKYFKY